VLVRLVLALVGNRSVLAVRVEKMKVVAVESAVRFDVAVRVAVPGAVAVVPLSW
jgi:hypothetical protein